MQLSSTLIFKKWNSGPKLLEEQKKQQQSSPSIHHKLFELNSHPSHYMPSIFTTMPYFYAGKQLHIQGNVSHKSWDLL